MIVLTGASGGVGTALLPSLAKMDTVLALYRRKSPEVPESADVVTRRVDLTVEREIKDCCAWIRENGRKITLIHGAAVSRDSLAARMTVADWDAVMAVGLRGNFLMTRELLTAMIEQKWGRIIQFSSVASDRGEIGTLAYSTAKAGLLGMSRVIAREYGRFGITSNVLALGYFEAGLTATLGESTREVVLKSVPSGKLGGVANIAAAIRFLIESEYTNGAVLNIDGGL